MPRHRRRPVPHVGMSWVALGRHWLANAMCQDGVQVLLLVSGRLIHAGPLRRHGPCERGGLLAQLILFKGAALGVSPPPKRAASSEPIEPIGKICVGALLHQKAPTALNSSYGACRRLLLCRCCPLLRRCTLCLRLRCPLRGRCRPPLCHNG